MYCFLHTVYMCHMLWTFFSFYILIYIISILVFVQVMVVSEHWMILSCISWNCGRHLYEQLREVLYICEVQGVTKIQSSLQQMLPPDFVIFFLSASQLLHCQYHCYKQEGAAVEGPPAMWPSLQLSTCVVFWGFLGQCKAAGDPYATCQISHAKYFSPTT